MYECKSFFAQFNNIYALAEKAKIEYQENPISDRIIAEIRNGKEVLQSIQDSDALNYKDDVLKEYIAFIENKRKSLTEIEFFLINVYQKKELLYNLLYDNLFKLKIEEDNYRKMVAAFNENMNIEGYNVALNKKNINEEEITCQSFVSEINRLIDELEKVQYE